MRLPASSAWVIASRIILTAYSASFATSCGYRWARRAINSDLVMRPFSPFFPCRPRSLRRGISLVELRTQQRAEVGRAGARRGLLAADLLHRVGLLGQVLSLDRQVDRAILAIDVDDHRLHRVALLENRTQILDPIARELGGAHVALDIHAGKRDYRALGVDRLDRAAHHAVLLVAPDEVGERVALMLLDPEPAALPLNANRQHHRLDFLGLLEVLDRLLARRRPGEIGQMYQAVDA